MTSQRHSSDHDDLPEPVRLGRLFDDIQRDGFPTDDFGELGRLGRVFHLDYHLFAGLVHDGEIVSFVDELEQAIFPFDVFEIALDGAPEMRFSDRGNFNSYHPQRYLLAMQFTEQRTSFIVADELELIRESGPTVRMASAFRFTVDAEANDETRMIPTAISPRGVAPFDAAKIEAEERANAYWLRILISCVRFAIVLNHRGVTLERFDDPLRPPTRQQRRAAGYVDREHYRIALRPRLTADNAMQDALSQRSLRYTPRRRHEVKEFERTYASGKVGPVRSHMRGGRLAPGPDYDARAAILGAIRDQRKVNDA